MLPPSYTELIETSLLFPGSQFWLVDVFLYFDVTRLFKQSLLFRIILGVGGTNLFLNCCGPLFLYEFYDQLSSITADPVPLWWSLARSWCCVCPLGSFCQRAWQAPGSSVQNLSHALEYLENQLWSQLFKHCIQIWFLLLFVCVLNYLLCLPFQIY